MRHSNPVLWIILLRTLQGCAAAGLLFWLAGWPLTGPHALGLSLLPALSLYFVFVFVAPWSWGLPILTRLKTRDKIVALTFDDGPSNRTTAILDCLRSFRVPATFFVLGEAVELFPELIQRMVSEGQSVGVHAWHHEPFVGLGRRGIAAEVQRTRTAVHAACAEVPPLRWLRPPHGFKSLRALWFARQMQMKLVAWNLDSRDYRDPCPVTIARRVLENLRPGAIVLLHDGPDNAATELALPLILTGLEARGYLCVSLEDAL